MSDKTDRYLDVLTTIAEWVTAAQAAVLVFEEDPPNSNQIDTARYHLNKLVEAGLAERSQPGGAGTPANWRLAPEPEETPEEGGCGDHPRKPTRGNPRKPEESAAQDPRKPEEKAPSEGPEENGGHLGVSSSSSGPPSPSTQQTDHERTEP